MNKIIFTAVAAPGAGKTQALIEQLRNLIISGEKIVIALPTLDLSSDIFSRMKSHGITPKVINSNDCARYATHAINGTLRCGNESVMIITHEGLRRCDHKLLRNYILVIDEVPDVFEIHHILNLSHLEAKQINSVTEERDGKLHIKNGLKTEISARVKTYQMAEKNNSTSTMLSKNEYKILETLLNQGIVHTDTYKRKDNGKTAYNFHTIGNKEVFKHIDSAKEAHILCANIEGGIFDLFAKKNGYRFKESRFTPGSYNYQCDITIYPMLNEPWSKGKVLRDNTGERHEEHLGLNNQLIDSVFATAINNSPTESFIAVQNNWGKFSKEYIPADHRPEIEFLRFDCRGLNTHDKKTAAIILLTGDPSPNDKKSFRVLADEHGLDIKELMKAWTITKKLEAALQAVTRTAIRVRENTKAVHFYVQDMSVAKYFINTYMPNAKIDNSLALPIPQKQDNRSNLNTNEKEKMFDYIRIMLKKGTPRPKVVKSIADTWDYSPTQARRFVRDISESTISEQEGLVDLTQFFVS
ncbi:DEAD/DEAH box helicase family protein [Pseudomonas citronellolis]|uniref:DEAD/DEAH box helicase family protein n=1 Tax=Pseudomonas citronellolis TaxID=53408 RepID=UPI0010657E32|nr:DEAD/DEAH box helicase family protein [Pseudomonas humi]